jgi:1,2-phenylacetyl-CoA epoxidase catalytic subunit
MELWKKIVEEDGEDILNLILMLHVNFYQAELDIIDVCARWIPRRSVLDEKFMLVTHASDEVRHAQYFKDGVEALGLKWDELDLKQLHLGEQSERFSKLLTSDDEIEVLVGLNLYAEGVLAMEELAQLHHNKPLYFPRFGEILADEGRHLKYGITVARRRFQDNEGARQQAQKCCDEFARHLQDYLWKEIDQAINLGTHLGYLDKDYRFKVARRFENVMSAVGLSVAWPADGPLSELRRAAFN